MLRLPSAAVSRRRAPTQLSSEGCCCEPTESTAEGSYAGTSPSSSSRACNHETLGCGIAAYEFGEEALGCGGSATVRLARPKAGGPCCALKALRKEGPAARRMASNEATIMRSLEHPGICKLRDTFEDDDNFYLVLEYIEGHELFEEVAGKEPMGERRAAEVMRQLLAALQHCHARGVVHRDLKPENVMVAGGAEPAVKLVDFGLAARDGQQLTGVAGTRPYLAPEALSGRGTCSTALDMWSVGIILYTCLLGELPPSAVRSGVQPVLQAGAWRNVRASAAAKDLVARLLRPEASERPTAAQAAQHAWLQPPAAPAAAAPRAAPPRSRPAACARAQMLGERRARGLRKQSAAAPARKEAPEQLLDWATGAAPLEHLDAMLGCVNAALNVLDGSGAGRVAAGQWLAWLDDAEAEAGAEAPAPPAFAFGGIFGGCCVAQEAEIVEAMEVVSAGALDHPPKEQGHHGGSATAEQSPPFGIKCDTMFGL